MTQNSLGDVLARLRKTIAARRGASPETSYTASLLTAGPARCAKKFGEEAVETALAGALERPEELVTESADLLFHWLVLLEATGVSLSDVAAALEAREGVSGHAEKAGREGR